MGALRFGTGIALAGLLAGCGNTMPATRAARSNTSRVGTPTDSRSAAPNPFTVTARYSASSLGLHNARDLAIGPSGNLYITDATDRVAEVSPAGKVVRRWGGHGTRPGEFAFVTVDTRDPNALAASIAVGPSGDV